MEGATSIPGHPARTVPLPRPSITIPITGCQAHQEILVMPDTTKKHAILKHRPPVSRGDLDTLMVTLCRSKAVRSHARRFITPDHFKPDEAVYTLLWEAVAA